MAATQVLRSGDLGDNLTKKGNQIVARTIIKQIDVASKSALVDSNDEVMPIEKWNGSQYRARAFINLRTLQLADFDFLPGGGAGGANRATLKAGTVLATIDRVEASTPYNFEGMTLWGTANQALEMEHMDDAGGPFGALFGQPLEQFPYLRFFTVSQQDGVAREPGEGPHEFASIYVTQQLGLGKLAAGEITYELTSESLLITLGDERTGEITAPTARNIDTAVGDTSVFPFADWANPTQAELDTAQATLNSGLLSAVYGSTNGNTAPPFQLAVDLIVPLSMVLATDPLPPPITS